MRRARIVIAAVRVECPACRTFVLNDEGDMAWNECVGREHDGEIKCEGCGELLIVPDVYSRIGSTLRLRHGRVL